MSKLQYWTKALKEENNLSYFDLFFLSSITTFFVCALVEFLK
ncbi:hypothetical protein [Burkholderia cenocepacia]|nr:hypothetical protein [Burkholderia cenocepacia]